MKMPTDDDPVTVVQGDALEVLRGLPSGCVDAVITDPPYSSGGMVRGDRNVATNAKYQHGDTADKLPNFSGDTRDQRSWCAWCSMWMTECLRVTKPGGVLVVFSDWRQLPTLTDAVQCGGWVWRGVVAWDKGNAIPQPNSFRQQCEFVVWATNGPREIDYQDGTYLPGFYQHKSPRERFHVTEKPVGLMRDLVKICPTDGVVLDPFAGSGTTGTAAVIEGRRALLIEKEPVYVDITRRRVAKASGAGSLFATAGTPSR